MSAWLGHWLRDIVLIVLFAAFVDLFVPDNALKKYVKLTISLMILLTILAPLIEWLKPGLDIRQAAFTAIEAGMAGRAEMPSLSAVLEAGGQLRREAENRAARLAEEQIAGQIRRQVGQAFPVTVLAADVRLGPGEEADAAEIKAIVLELAPRRDGPADGETPFGDRAGSAGNGDAGMEESGAAARVRSVAPVERVRPVAVSVPSAREPAPRAGTEAFGAQAVPVAGGAAGPDNRAGPGGDAGSGAKPSGTPGDPRLAADVAAQVGIWWGIDSRRVAVRWAED